MSLRDVLAQLDVQVRGAGAVRSANVELDQYAAAATGAQSELERLRVRQVEASELASRLAGRVRILQRAEGDNSAEIEQTRIAMLRAQSQAQSYGQAIARLSTEEPSLLSRMTTSWTELSSAMNVVSSGFRVVESAGRAVAGQLREVISAGSDIGATAVRLNLSARALQEWNFVAESSNTSAEAIQHAFPAIARALSSSNGARVFHELGVSVRDASGALRSQEDVFADSVAAIGRVSNQTDQARLAQRAFGRAGQDLLPLIRSAPGDLDRLRGRFRELGGGLSDDVVVNAGKADQAMREFDLATESARATIAGAFLPSLASGITTIAGFVGKVREAWETSSGGIVVMKTLGLAVRTLVPVLLLAFSPVIILGAAIFGLFLIVEDLVTAFRGGRSVIGGFWHTFEAEALGSIANAMAAVHDFQTAMGIREGSGVGVSAEAVAGVRARAGAAAARAAGDQVAVASDRQRAAQEAAVAAAPAAERGAVRGEAPRRPELAAGATVDASSTYHIHGATDPDATVRAIEAHDRRRLREAADVLPVAPARAR